MGRAKLVDVNLDLRIFADDSACRAGVVEVDMRQQDGVERSEVEASGAKLLPQDVNRGFRARIN